MLMDNEKIHSEAEFKALCSIFYKEFEKVGEYIREHIYLPDITSNLTTSGKRDTFVHKYNNLAEVINIVSNAVKDTAPKIDI